MLVLMCEAGESRYALDTSDVVEVIPFVRLETVTGAPAWLRGMFVYRGVAVHVADLTHLTSDRPCPRRWNSRIIVAKFNLPNMPEMLGLLAERVTTAEIDTQSVDATQKPAELSTCGRVLLDQRGMFQLIEPSRLFTEQRLQALQAIVSENRE